MAVAVVDVVVLVDAELLMLDATVAFVLVATDDSGADVVL